MGNYYIMEALCSAHGNDPSKGYMEIEEWTDLAKEFRGWGVGSIANRRPNGPVEFRAIPHDGYSGLPDDFSNMNVPLMSARLKEAIESAGVDNIDFLPVIVRNSESGQAYQYFAFNLLGLVSAVDMSKSNIKSPDGDFIGDSHIYDLVIDEPVCRGLLMFRLAEKFTTIVVHQRVKDAIESRSNSMVKFIKPEDYMAL